MKIPLPGYLVLLLALGLFRPTAYAQEVTNPNFNTDQEASLAEMAAKSSFIVEGKATGARGFWNADHTRICTATTIEVYKVFKGKLKGNQIEIVTLGGNVDNLYTIVADDDKLPVGGVGLFFGVPTKQGTQGSELPANQVLDIFGYYQGYFSYRGDGADYNTAVTASRTYRDIGTTLYAPIQKAVGQPYQELVPFDIDTYDRYSDLRPTPATAPQKKNTSTKSAPLSPNAAPVITSVLAKQASGPPLANGAVKAGTFDEIIIRGTNLTDNTGNKPAVFFSNVDKLQNPNLNARVPAPVENITAASATELTLYVPSNVLRTVGGVNYDGVAGTGYLQVENANGSSGNSPQPLTIYRAETNVDFPGLTASARSYRQLRYVGPSNQGGYEFYYDGSYFNNPFAVREAQRAFRQWRQATQFNVGDNVTSDEPINYNDGVANVAFVAPSAGGPNFMRTLVTATLCTDNNTNGRFLYIIEADIQINPAPVQPWHYDGATTTVPSGKRDFYSAFLHEVGHAAGLAHINDATKVMHPVTPAPGTSRRTLQSEPELNGVANAFTRSQQRYTCQASEPAYPALMRPLTSAVEQTGGQVTLSDTLVFYNPCPNTTTRLALSASGTPQYTWGSQTRFSGTYPHTSSVTFNAPPTDRVFVYGTQYGLGDTGIARLTPYDNVWCPPTSTNSTASQSQSTAYPNPAANDFTLSYQPGPRAAKTNLEFILYNAQGTALQTFRFPANSQPRQIPMRGFRAGTYFLRTVEDGQTVSTLRLQVK